IIQKYWKCMPDSMRPARYADATAAYVQVQEQLDKEKADDKDPSAFDIAKQSAALALAMRDCKDQLNENKTSVQEVVEDSVGWILDVAPAAADAVNGAFATARSAIASLSVAGDVIDGVSDINAVLSSVPEPVSKSLAIALSAIQATKDVGMAGAGVGIAANELRKGDKDPIKELMLMEDLVESVEDLIKSAAGSAVEIIGAVLPIVSAVATAAGAGAELYAAFKRIRNAAKDGLLLKDAAKLTPELMPALHQSLNRELQRAAKHIGMSAGMGVEAFGEVTATVGEASAGADDGATALAGAGIIITGKSIQLGTRGTFTISSWANAAASVALLGLARVGVEKAQQELFRHSGKHAKCIIAIKAKEKDPVALAYIKSRGLTPEMIEASSPEIIRMYLLRRSKEKNFGDTNIVTEAIDLGKNVATMGRRVVKKLNTMRINTIKRHYDEIYAAEPPFEMDALSTTVTDLARLQRRYLLKSVSEDQRAELAPIIQQAEINLRRMRERAQETIQPLQESLRTIHEMETVALQHRAAHDDRKAINRTLKASGEAQVDAAAPGDVDAQLVLLRKHAGGVHRQLSRQWEAMSLISHVV
ncbi:MAG: hypothetical protein AAFV53_32860, partial [Myxococcota bacterium]